MARHCAESETNAQSVTADFYNEEERGKVFGTLHLTSAAGAAFGGLYATNMGILRAYDAHLKISTSAHSLVSYGRQHSALVLIMSYDLDL